MEFFHRVSNPLKINIHAYRYAYHTTPPDPSSPVNIRFLLRKCDQFFNSPPDSAHANGIRRIEVPTPVAQTIKSFPQSLFSAPAPAPAAIHAPIAKALSIVLFWPVARELDQGTRDAILQMVVDKGRRAVAQGVLHLEVEICMTVNYVGGVRRHWDHRMAPAAEGPAVTTTEELLQKEVAVEGQICVVCLGDLSEATRMPCSHSFHGECIGRWLERSHTCPVCRYEMPIRPKIRYVGR